MFYGWWIVGVGFIAQALAIGATTYCFGYFVKPVAEEFGSQRTEVMLGMTLMMLVVGVCSPFLGRELDRRSIRRIMLAGGVAMSLGFLVMSTANSLASLGLPFVILVGLGSAALGPLAVSTAVANWFVRQRGRALGVSSVGTSAGGFLLPPVLAVSMAIFGWRGALAVFGVLIGSIVIPLVAWKMVGRPEEIGMGPDGGPPATPSGDDRAGAGGWTFRGLLGERNFWAIGLGAGIPLAVIGSVIANLPAYATDLGLSAAQAALLMSLLSAAGIAGKLIFGALADFLDKRLLMVTAMGIMVVFLAVLLTEPSYVVLLVGCAAAGLALGGFLPVWGAMIGDSFGRQAYGQVMGLMSPLMMPVNLVALPFGTWSYDTTGSYDLAFQVFIAAVLVSVFVVMLLRAPRVGPIAPRTASAG